MLIELYEVIQFLCDPNYRNRDLPINVMICTLSTTGLQAEVNMSEMDIWGELSRAVTKNFYYLHNINGRTHSVWFLFYFSYVTINVKNL